MGSGEVKRCETERRGLRLDRWSTRNELAENKDASAKPFWISAAILHASLYPVEDIENCGSDLIYLCSALALADVGRMFSFFLFKKNSNADKIIKR